jgi:hypothetical protein
MTARRHGAPKHRAAPKPQRTTEAAHVLLFGPPHATRALLAPKRPAAPVTDCEACGGAARYIVNGRCTSCGHVQGEPLDPRIWKL